MYDVHVENMADAQNEVATTNFGYGWKMLKSGLLKVRADYPDFVLNIPGISDLELLVGFEMRC